VVDQPVAAARITAIGAADGCSPIISQGTDQIDLCSGVVRI
jgi:hypothetical protein